MDAATVVQGLAASGTGLVITGPSAEGTPVTVQVANPAATTLLGRDPVGQPLTALFDADEAPEQKAARDNALAQATSTNGVAPVTTRAGRQWLAWDLAPLGGDGTAGFVLTLHDATLLDEARSEAAAAARELQEFAYMASHDLQEPVRMVSSYLGLLKRRLGTALDQDAQDFMDYAVDGAKRMQGMIKGLLQYSRVQTHGQPLEPVALQPLLESLQQETQLAVEECQGKVTFQGTATADAMVLADPQQVRTVLRQLVDNAVRYRHPERPLALTLSTQPGDDGRWLVTVRDNGSGVAPEDQDRIFKLFQRAGSNAAAKDGSGLGLALAKRVVERHHGTLTVDSRPGEGATFTFSLPAAEAP